MFIPVKKVEEEGMTPSWGSLDTAEETVGEVARGDKESITNEEKIEVFKEIKSIDDLTAILLYNYGFTTIASLKYATVKDLTNIKGITKKQAKLIKKEINKKMKESAKVKPITMGSSANGLVTDEMIKEEVISKDIEGPAPVELHEKKSEWEPIEDIEETVKFGVENEEKINVFKDIKSIDEWTAVLLYDNGFTTLDALTIASINDLTKIKGIKRITAKKIKKEIEQKAKPFYITDEKSTDVTKEEGVTEYFEAEESEAFEIDKKIQELEPVEVEEDGFFEEKIEEASPVKEDESAVVFKDIPSIDEKTAKLLKENGIDSVDVLKTKTIKDLTKIRGIKRKTAKQIKKEIEVLSKETSNDTDITTFETVEKPLKEADTEEWVSFDEERIAESQKREFEGFMHGDYTLYQKEIETKTGKKRIVRFFSKAEPEDGEPIDLPKGFEIKENKKTGLPYLKKKK
jgi:ERCC4-type nuclease